MKKIKYLLPLLTAVFLLIPGIKTEAATKKELPSGTKSTTLTMTLSNCQSIEGKINVKSKTNGKTITLQSVSAQTNDKDKTAVCETSGKKVYMVSKGDPVTTTVNVVVQFSGDGTYVVTLSGGCTDKDGAYDESGLSEKISVIVGTSASSTETEEDEEDEEAEKEEKEDEEEEDEKKTVDDKDDEDNEKTGITKKSSSIKDKEGTTGSTTRESVKTLEEDEPEERAIEEILKEAEEEMEEELERNPKTEEIKVSTPKSFGDLWKYLKNFFPFFLIILLFLLVCAYWLWKLIRHKTADYDGAPMVDYKIEDDDE